MTCSRVPQGMARRPVGSHPGSKPDQLIYSHCVCSKDGQATVRPTAGKRMVGHKQGRGRQTVLG